MSQRGFIPILILVGILIVAILAGGAYYSNKLQFIKPTAQDETTNWKTYTDTIANISFKYPSDRRWYIDNSTYNNSNYHILLYPVVTPATVRGIQIDVLPNPIKTDLLTYIRTKASNDPSNWYHPQYMQILNLSGHQAIRVTFVAEKIEEGTVVAGPVVFIAGNNNFIEIKYGLHSEKSDKSEEAELKIFDQIISSFKILDSSNQVASPLVSKPDNYLTELQGYPIYPNAKFLRKERHTPSDYDARYGATQNTTSYIFTVDATGRQIHDWYYVNKEDLLGWKFSGGGEGISSVEKGDQSFDLLWGGPGFTIRVGDN